MSVPSWGHTECACAPLCDGHAEQTEYSPYMDDYCHDCTMHRCDAVGAHSSGCKVGEVKG